MAIKKTKKEHGKEFTVTEYKPLSNSLTKDFTFYLAKGNVYSANKHIQTLIEDEEYSISSNHSLEFKQPNANLISKCKEDVEYHLERDARFKLPGNTYRDFSYSVDIQNINIDNYAVPKYELRLSHNENNILIDAFALKDMEVNTTHKSFKQNFKQEVFKKSKTIKPICIISKVLLWFSLFASLFSFFSIFLPVSLVYNCYKPNVIVGIVMFIFNISLFIINYNITHSAIKEITTNNQQHKLNELTCLLVSNNLRALSQEEQQHILNCKTTSTEYKLISLNLFIVYIIIYVVALVVVYSLFKGVLT